MTNNEKRIEDEDDCFHGVPESECCRCVVIKLEAKNKLLEKRVKELEEACKKALTCASINSDVRSLIQSALTQRRERMSEIKLPVRYDEQTKSLGYGSWRDADGIYLFQDSGALENSFLLHKERNEYIALCINEHASLLAEIERLREREGKLREALAEITKGEGKFNRDPLTHANNVITHSINLAEAVLADTAEGEK